MWFLAACTPEVDEPPARAALPPLAVDGPVWTAAVLDVPAEIPPRFSAMFATPPSLALPAEPDRYPPVGKVQDGLCTGDGPWREQALAAVRATSVLERWRFWEVFVQPGCTAPDWCDWLAREAAALPGEEGRPLWLGLATCSGPAVAGLVAEGAPEGAYLEWVRLHPGPLRPRVAEIARHALSDLPVLDAALTILQQTDGAEAEHALLEVHRAAPLHLKAHVGAFLGERTDPAARRIHARSCNEAPSAACELRRVDGLRAIERGDVWVGAAEDLLAQYPNQRAALAEALRRCATERKATGVAARCATALAHVDRAAAERAVAGADPSTPELYELRASLAVGPAQMVRHLAELGFEGLAVPDDAGALTALEVLVAGGRAVRIDDGGGWPQRHDRLLYRLARASGLEGVEFAELPPWDGPSAFLPGRTPRTALFAWADGRRLRTLAEDGEHGWDVARATGLVNAVLAKRGAPDRVAIASGWDVAVAGPPSALRALSDQGLAHWATWEEELPLDDTDLPFE